MSIASKELFPVVVSAAIFGRYWSGRLVNFRVDNLAVVQVIQATYSRETHLMHLIRLLVLFAAHFNFWFIATHVMGEKNTFADALSRRFISLTDATHQSAAYSNSPAVTGASSSEHHMDLHLLDPAIRLYFSSALAVSSYKTYKAAENKYLSFCNNFSLQPLPCTEATLCYFVACLGQQGLAHSSIRTYLSGVRQLQIAHGFPDPSFN